MAKREHSSYQHGVIKRYYDNLPGQTLTKLGELVTELYLTKSPKKLEQLWGRAEKAMAKLKIPPAIIKHIMEREDVQILAKNLQDWQAGKIGKA